MNLIVDGGNNQIKIKAINKAGKESLYFIPTLVAKYEEHCPGLESITRSFPYNLDATVIHNFKSNNRECNFGRYYIGKLAKDNEGTISCRTIGSDKLGDRDMIISVLSSIAAICNIENDYVVNLIISLPLSQYKADNQQYAAQWEGKHRVILHQENNKPIDFSIPRCSVEVEGLNALNKIIEDNPAVQNVGKIIIGFDIGEMTTEVMAIKIGEEDEEMMSFPFRKLCLPLEKGVANAKQKVIKYLMMQHRTKVDRYDIDDCLKRKFNKNKINLESGMEFDIEQTYNSALYNLSSDIVKTVYDIIKDDNEKRNIECVYLYGGAPEVLDFKKYFIADVKKYFEVDCYIKENPVLANIDSISF